MCDNSRFAADLAAMRFTSAVAALVSGKYNTLRRRRRLLRLSCPIRSEDCPTAADLAARKAATLSPRTHAQAASCHDVGHNVWGCSVDSIVQVPLLLCFLRPLMRSA